MGERRHLWCFRRNVSLANIRQNATHSLCSHTSKDSSRCAGGQLCWTKHSQHFRTSFSAALIRLVQVLNSVGASFACLKSEVYGSGRGSGAGASVCAASSSTAGSLASKSERKMASRQQQLRTVRTSSSETVACSLPKNFS